MSPHLGPRLISAAGLGRLTSTGILKSLAFGQVIIADHSNSWHRYHSENLPDLEKSLTSFVILFGRLIGLFSHWTRVD